MDNAPICVQTHLQKTVDTLPLGKYDPFLMALRRETRESIHQIIRIITIQWTAPADDGGSPITGYRMILQKGETEIEKNNITDPGTTYSFRGLEKDTNYMVKLFSRNFVFEGDPIVRKISTLFEGEESQMIS